MACFPSTKMRVNWVNWPSNHMWNKVTGHVTHAEAAGSTCWHWHSSVLAVFPLPSRNRGRRCRPSWQALSPQLRRTQLANSPADTRHHIRPKWNIKHRTHWCNLQRLNLHTSLKLPKPLCLSNESVALWRKVSAQTLDKSWGIHKRSTPSGPENAKISAWGLDRSLGILPVFWRSILFWGPVYTICTQLPSGFRCWAHNNVQTEDVSHKWQHTWHSCSLRNSCQSAIFHRITYIKHKRTLSPPWTWQRNSLCCQTVLLQERHQVYWCSVHTFRSVMIEMPGALQFPLPSPTCTSTVSNVRRATAKKYAHAKNTGPLST